MKIGIAALVAAGILGVRLLILSGVFFLAGCFSGGKLGVYWEPIDSIKTVTETHAKSWPCRIWPMENCPFDTKKVGE